MKVLVQAKNISVTPMIERAVQHQAQKLGRLSSKIVQVFAFLEVIDKKKNDAQAARVLYKICWPGKDIVVQEKASNLYDAIVDATDSAMRVLRKAKERRRNYRMASKRAVSF